MFVVVLDPTRLQTKLLKVQCAHIFGDDPDNIFQNALWNFGLYFKGDGGFSIQAAYKMLKNFQGNLACNTAHPRGIKGHGAVKMSKSRFNRS